jgi:hypothetical protein
MDSERLLLIAQADGINEALFEALDFLGTTALAVAQTLKEAGIQGNPTDYNTCPIARWLMSLEFWGVSIGNETVEVGGMRGYGPAYHYESEGTVDLPVAVKDFTRTFDSLFRPPPDEDEPVPEKVEVTKEDRSIYRSVLASW